MITNIAVTLNLMRWETMKAHVGILVDDRIGNVQKPLIIDRFLTLPRALDYVRTDIRT